MKKKQIFLIIMLAIFGISFAQNESPFLQNAIKIYIDCDDCDMDYIREEIQFVNYVRDREIAEVHILFTDQNTGGGGVKYTIDFIGQGRFRNINNVLTFIKEKTDSEDDFRKKTVAILKLGLIRYVSCTPIAEDISISYYQPQQMQSDETDNWNNWVFSLSLSCWLNGEKSSNNYNLWGRVSAKRITEELKTFFSLDGSYNKNHFEYDDLTYESSSESKGFYCSFIKSINEHWSYGCWLDTYQSDYGNIDFAVVLSPGIEYNIFPYSESNKKQFRFQYKIRPGYFNYQTETVYERKNDKVIRQSFIVEMEFVRKWGSLSTNFTASNYLKINESFLGDLEKNKLSLYCSASINLFEGLSLELWGNISRVHDQISLPAGDVTTEELLLKQRELETQYTYWGSIGLTYSFGSIYNNIVNPRFGN